MNDWVTTIHQVTAFFPELGLCVWSSFDIMYLIVYLYVIWSNGFQYLGWILCIARSPRNPSTYFTEIESIGVLNSVCYLG
jgi:hypothetical protein